MCGGYSSFPRRWHEKLWDSARTEQPHRVIYDIKVRAAAIRAFRALQYDKHQSPAAAKQPHRMPRRSADGFAGGRRQRIDFHFFGGSYEAFSTD